MLNKKLTAIILTLALTLVAGAAGCALHERNGGNGTAPVSETAIGTTVKPETTAMLPETGKPTEPGDNTRIGDDAVIIGDWTYYSNDYDDWKLYKIKTDGSENQLLANDRAHEINITGDRIYYRSYYDNESLYTIKTDGAGRQKLNDNPAYNIIVIDDKIFYTNGNDNFTIYSIKIDGTDIQKLNNNWSINVSVSGDRIYYNNVDDNRKLYSMNFDGSDDKPAG